MQLKGNNFLSKIKELNANIIFEDELNQLSIAGEINEVESSDSFVFSELEFLLEGINGKDKKIDIKASNLNFDYINEYGKFKISGKNLSGKGLSIIKPSLVLNLKDLNLDMSKIIALNENRVIQSKFGQLKLKLLKDKAGLFQ